MEYVDRDHKLEPIKEATEVDYGVHTLNASTQDTEAGGSLSCEASLIYRESSGTARTTQRNPSQQTSKQKNRKVLV